MQCACEADNGVTKMSSGAGALLNKLQAIQAESVLQRHAAEQHIFLCQFSKQQHKQ
jgi:hypothetical protein